MTQLEIKREAVRKPFNRRRKACPFSGPNAPKIDYKDTKLLLRYTSERAKLYRHAFRLYQLRNSVNLQPPSNAHGFWH